MKLSNKKVVVTGGAGFIGSHLVDELAKEHDVVVLDNLSSGSAENLAAALSTRKVTLRIRDLRQDGGLAECLNGAGMVFHLATHCPRRSTRSDLDIVHEVNATGVLNLLRACREANIEKFIYVSSSEVYGTAKSVPLSEDHSLEPTTVYGVSKLAGELYTRVYQRMYNLPAVIVRPFSTYGPRAHFGGFSGEVIPQFVARVLAGKPPMIFGTGQQTRDFIHVTDVVRGILLAAEKLPDGGIVNLGSGREVSISEVADSVIWHAGYGSLHPVRTKPRPGDQFRHFADIRRARVQLGFSPQMPFEVGLRLYLDWFRHEFAEKAEELVAAEVELQW